MGMPHREVEADRNLIVLHILMEHRIHIVETILRVLVLIELSHNDASDMRDESSHLHIMEHTIHLTHPLARILHKQDDILQKQGVEIRAGQIVVDREITPHDDTLCPTLDIQRMGRYSGNSP